MPHPQGSEERDEEDDDDVGLRRCRRKRMTRSASNSIRECESNSDSEDELALLQLGRMAVIDRRRRNVHSQDVYSPSQDSDSEWDIRLPQPKCRKLGSLPIGRTVTRAARRHASSKYDGTKPQQVLSLRKTTVTQCLPSLALTKDESRTLSLCGEKQTAWCFFGWKCVPAVMSYQSMACPSNPSQSQ